MATKTFGKHVCQFCGMTFVATHNRQTTFCAIAHKKASNDLDKIRGRVLVKLVQTMRMGKKSKDPAIKAAVAYAFQEVSALGDRYNREDREAGRPSAVGITRIMMATGRRPSVDR